ncbi:low-specificity L-threonine aldolase [Brassicibacter mesophilus]|uniref:low-specificity L-threonine aldolase n=1 Tax=Brassicibacter mesophilus TaxID=745119 RepID=UPI003D1A0B4F
MKIVDFRSDTLTKPTEEMRKAMYQAEVGDDVYREDPTVKELERLAASKLGKEDALLVPSGTMGNQLALMTHTQRGQEVILEDWAHIFRYEAGGLAFLSGLQARTIAGTRGIMNVNDIKAAIIKDDDLHHAQTGLICIENTHNMAGGVVIPLDKMKDIYNTAKGYSLPVHLDGARLFNAATYLKCDASEIARYTDSVMFCLSKGLCAPVGSILAGNTEFIDKARKYRKMLGGGMRQAGIIAAAGIISLNDMVDRLVEDHENAYKLAEGLSNIKGISIDFETVQTNIVMANISGTGLKSDELVMKIKEKGILASSITDNIIRFVTHKYVENIDIDYSLDVINEILK